MFQLIRQSYSGFQLVVKQRTDSRLGPAELCGFDNGTGAFASKKQRS